MNSTTEARLNEEAKSLGQYGELEVTAGIEGDLRRWSAVLLPPEESLFHDRRFKVHVTVPDTYPSAPPKVQIATPLYHPNISTSGAIDMSALVKDWSPALTIEKVLIALLALLDAPNLDSPLRPEAAELYLTDREAYERKARQASGQYAG